MAVLSKLRELSLPYNCYEVGHTWDPECYTAALSVGACCLLEGMKIYAPLYLISQILQRKFSLDAFINTIQSIRTSSCFLGVNGFAFIFIFCLFRRAMGKFYYLHCSYFPAFVASFLAILVERKNRRGPLALYVTNVASETMFRMAVARGIVKPVANGEIYLFSSVMAMFLYIFVNCLLRWLFEKDQAIYAIPAAFLGGLFMKFFPSSTLSLYLMWKLIENGYLIGMEEGVLPKIRGSMLMLYATSTAFLFYAAVLEPHNLKPAYLKFLTRLTHNKIGEINRHVLDIFGTHASKLYSDFWPELDLRHTSRVFQESVLLWLIH
ncbi:transmembrane protein 135 [Trichonephila inaurata madagascariensis]|uniref:Transmembrane protein 135 n=1 Tax=Trichonephila inaurata madagascariensis TaxID=2747483 RepID=A0A8X6KLD4_9ARAC|nr:transmembrane protein 135 [Trichonephila inaurata madagascariensis]